MSLHPSTFEYLKPTDAQINTMSRLREASKTYAEFVDAMLPDCPDKTYIMRHIRETAMWINIVVTRHSDGAPRS